MAITRVWVDEGYITCGMSEDSYPEVFIVMKVATVIGGVNYSEFEKKIKEAAKGCPVEVIKYEEA
jgi:ferredoxin